MNFGLDYDGTITEEVFGFKIFVDQMRKLGHSVYITTMRYPSEALEIVEMWGPLVDGVIATGRLAKKPFCEKMGIDIHVWIDDHPRAVNEDGVQIWNWHLEEGKIDLINHADPHPPEVPQ